MANSTAVFVATFDKFVCSYSLLGSTFLKFAAFTTSKLDSFIAKKQEMKMTYMPIYLLSEYVPCFLILKTQSLGFIRNVSVTIKSFFIVDSKK